MQFCFKTLNSLKVNRNKKKIREEVRDSVKNKTHLLYNSGIAKGAITAMLQGP